MPSAREIFALMQPAWPRSLVPREAGMRLRRVSAKLPLGSATYYLECRLNRAVDVDLEVGYPFPAYKKLLPGFNAASQVAFVLLEMDRADPGVGPGPGLLLGLDRKMGIHACGRAVPALTPARFLKVAREASECFLGRPVSPELDGTLRACFASLPRGGRILHLSAMPSRKPPLLKLNLVMPKPALRGYLQRVGWTGKADALDSLWESIHPFCRFAKFDLILEKGVHPKLGLELFPSNSTLKGRRAALQWVAARGLGLPEKCSEMSAWYGPLWRPDAAGRRLIRIGLDFGIKIVFDGPASCEAKGYLQVHPPTAMM
jgi:hypothetical protein